MASMAAKVRFLSTPARRAAVRIRLLLMIGLPLASLVFTELMLPGGLIRRLFGSGDDDPGVKVIEQREGAGTHVILTTANCLDLTISVAATSQNMRVSPALPEVVETHGQRQIELFRYEPIDNGKPSPLHYTYRWSYGGRGGAPDDTAFQLPFASNARHRLIQGYGGSFSHERGSPNEFADDWDLPVGSVVRAARGGVVVGVRSDSNAGGVGARFLNSANYVIVRHSDGTYGEYLHLERNGARVKLGDTVQAGQTIALSGNTGNTSRPHLHFAVFRILADNTRQSLPVKFVTKDGTIETLEQGKSY